MSLQDDSTRDLIPGGARPREANPRLIAGRYKLLQRLGEGGMGEVWLAEQTEPVRRQVAVKIIRADLDSTHVLARFEAERQALAMMDHPNIAKVLDAGTTGIESADHNRDRPFFAMELVKGIPITKYCDQEKLTPQHRLELFIPVCNAIQHAHQKGIIHRDLKPSNILVALYDGRPVPKVIDFGIAKATHQKLTERTLFTEVGQFVGTPTYMPPEQAEVNNLDIDTRADIYSLGVVLYELLTGTTPFTMEQLRSAGFIEMLRIIKEVEPSKPSTKLSSSDSLPSVAALRRLEPKRLTKLMSGDLDWIVMKCLEKERSRRYETANGLGMDIQRYLSDEPVSAGRPSAAYRLRKFVRRNRGPVIAVILVLLVLLAGIVGTTWALFEARRQERAARQQQLRADDEARKAQDNLKEAHRQQKQRALAQVDTLIAADPRAVPSILASLAEQRDEVLPRLREVWNEPDRPDNRQRRLRVALALLPVEPNSLREDLVRGMLEADDPAESIVIRDALLPYAESLKAALWKRVKVNYTDRLKLRLLAALATFDPKNDAWDQVGDVLLNPWLSANPLHLGIWTAAFRPVRAKLVPMLCQVFRGERLAEQKQVAANILADYAADQPETLVELLLVADDRQFDILTEREFELNSDQERDDVIWVMPNILEHRGEVTKLLRRELAKSPPKDEPPVDGKVRDWNPAWSEAQHEEFAKRRSGAALALLHLPSPQHPLIPVKDNDDSEIAWQVLRHSAYPEARTRLLHRLAATRVPINVVLKRLEIEKDVSIRQALILALGEYSDAQVPRVLRDQWIPRLIAMYRSDADAGIHSALDWLLRPERDGPKPRPLMWGQRAKVEEIDLDFKKKYQAESAAAVAGQVASTVLPIDFARALSWTLLANPIAVTAPLANAGWYVNSQGQAFAVIDSRAPFLMGSPVGEAGLRENETLHWRKIGRTYAMQTKAVTVAEFERFLKANPLVFHGYMKQYSPVPDGPIITVTWYDAAQYCRWLSEQEGIPENQMVYPSVAEIEKCKKNGTPLVLPKDHLRRTGYRLPTEAEWEFACRAGTRTSRSFGSSPEFLTRYGWFLSNSEQRSWPVGQKKPNDWGLFDTHGNVWTWCQEAAFLYKTGTRAEPVLDESLTQSVTDRISLLMRAGSFANQPSDVRSSYRGSDRPTNRNSHVGFRAARTLP